MQSKRNPQLLIHSSEEWLELNYDTTERIYRLYASFGIMSKGKRAYFSMDRRKLTEFRDKINKVLRET